MDLLSLLRAAAAILTIVAALLVAANWSPRTMVLGFTVFIVASVAWIVDGWLEDKLSDPKHRLARHQHLRRLALAAESLICVATDIAVLNQPTRP
jgi:hypothetical protein